MKDFFISYTGKDEMYATWIAKILEDEGYLVTIQAWDFRGGDNFVSKINESLLECKKLIVVLSKGYLESKWCEAEWTSKLTEQINLNERRIIPVRIEAINVTGLLAPIVYIDIVDKSEKEAKEKILEGISDICIRGKNVEFPKPYNVEHIKIDNDYQVYDSYIVFIKTCQTRILTGGKNSIHNRITWFDDENVELQSMSEDKKIDILDIHDTNLNYNVVFDHILEENEVVEYCVKAILTNNNGHFRNFFSTEIITPVEDLYIHINIKDNDIKKIYTQKLSSSVMNYRTEKPEEHFLYNSFHWPIKKPELHFEYKVFW